MNERMRALKNVFILQKKTHKNEKQELEFSDTMILVSLSIQNFKLLNNLHGGRTSIHLFFVFFYS